MYTLWWWGVIIKDNILHYMEMRRDAHCCAVTSRYGRDMYHVDWEQRIRPLICQEKVLVVALQ